MPRRPNASPLAIDINLDREPGVFILRGSPEESPSVAVRGNVVITTPDSMTLKRLSLRLVGNLKIRWNESFTSRQSSNVQYPLRYEKVVYEQDYDDIDFAMIATSGSRTPLSGRTTPISSMTNLASYFSAAHGSGGSGTSTPVGNHVRAGTHVVPFEFVVPGSIPETVEGNTNVQYAYTLIVTAERGRFHPNLVGKKHLRFVRTLGVDLYDSNHTVSVTNTWPDKIDYNIVLQSKSAAIGSRFEVGFEFQPVLKGLRLKTIHAVLVEMLSISPPGYQTNNSERVVFEKLFDVDRPDFMGPDQWNFSLSLKLPSSLGAASQDCAMVPHFKITHKLKIFVALRNPDGHTSELRASLPMVLFISPAVRISTGNLAAPPRTEEEARSSSQEILFDTTELEGPDSGSAPPNYNEHVYDQVWSDMPTPLSLSPTMSGLHTPFSPNSRRPMPGFDPAEAAQLQAGLRELALRQNQETPPAVDIVALSRVPSYDSAVNRHQALPATAPRYETQ
ncbi:Protein ROD1 [Wickerhamiella sorbophila]|uniref:Protein ROD1 n=1 Tax=Wickerhamiella sorbophila TaxID=45607 RepID=A0A2T0FDY2_9ASCO|nr:Protein ROD1 [Wickerhamiella sorbophila]PRT53214.1 Protein ROD1 [Wickerhamiella sorbophila]